jgi:Gamma-glutamyl cyclotransferase, AIG2-like
MPLLFSYGTLQREDVQLLVFGRRLQGRLDELVGFEKLLITIDEPRLIAQTGTRDHVIVKFNGRIESRVPGSVFEITDEELASADRYEVDPYLRVQTLLASGIRAWVYVDARYLEADG